METKITSDFDLDAVRLSQDYTSMVGVKKLILTIPVRKPNNQCFIRVRQGENWRLFVGLLNFKDENETYLVMPDLYNDLSHEITPTLLFTSINRQNVVFIWPIKQPDSEGRIDTWNRSAMEAASAAETSWIRVVANSSLGGYDIFEASANLDEPHWPDMSFEQIVGLGFKGRIIKTLDHPAIQRLRGSI
jgi:hypothetical protein